MEDKIEIKDGYIFITVFEEGKQIIYKCTANELLKLLLKIKDL